MKAEFLHEDDAPDWAEYARWADLVDQARRLAWDDDETTESDLDPGGCTEAEYRAHLIASTYATPFQAALAAVRLD